MDRNSAVAPIKPQFIWDGPVDSVPYRTHHQTDPLFLAAKATEEAELSRGTKRQLETDTATEAEAVQKDFVQIDKQADPLPPPTEDKPKKRDNKQKKGKGGQNKQRNNQTPDDEIKFCSQVAMNGVCNFGPTCKFSHDTAAYLASKGDDLPGVCPLFREFGRCRFGIRCRFAFSHSRLNEETGVREFNVENTELVSTVGTSKDELNRITKVHLDAFKRERKDAGIPESIADSNKWVASFRDYNKFKDSLMKRSIKEMKEKRGETAGEVDHENEANYDSQFQIAMNLLKETEPATVDEYETRTRQFIEDDAKFAASCRDDDRAGFEWKGTYLAPLTTVGNLPFRRLAKTFGVDITCAEMAMANNIEGGAPHEWALTRRHPSETKFGIQLAIGTSNLASGTGYALNKLLFDNASIRHPTLKPFDFVDINCGCPIDMIYKMGSGSALMARRSRLHEIIAVLKRTMPVPVTVKLRTGIMDSTNLAHKLIPLVKEWGASAVTVHGRSRQQRYTKFADWEYVNECSKIARASGIPMFGNGDVLSFEDYYSHMPNAVANEDGSVDGIMVGRGALIKPWIFQEIEERKVWDISGQERFDLFKKFADYGMEHWGTDTKGVNLTRTYLLEWMSFTYRYVPVGLLETLPSKFNERPPPFVGRDYYETLLASPKVSDWIYVTEKILGKTPAGFHFTPKHKSNSYEPDSGIEESVHG
ncbi:hypothetical protein CcCBS67573_g01370 [Chytriomyces confervae]|uniref:tRNA-dihydrouridine(47) synthase [NAD(P)(+)] n=1 Tax=Chytriomyces confervae TaxID=246404 RepID=A0A507FMA6_9FUNG|nr:hypothetical protein CcCBS67573_g01370 [Chytriomyces confervae]